MLNIRQFHWLAIPMILCFASAGALATNGIRDDAHFFSPQAISQAQQVIDQIDRRHNRDILIETFPAIPADKKSSYDPQNRSAFFEQWTQDRALQQGVEGVYILICRNPPHLEVALGSGTRVRLFTDANRQQLTQRLLSDFRNKHYDAGLLGAVRFVQQRMDVNASAAGTTSVPPGNYSPRPSIPTYQYHTTTPRGWGIGGLACFIIAVALIIALVRGLFARSGGSYYGGGPGGYYPPQGGAYPPGGYYGGGYGGGGGFGRGFLGGLLGGALGGYAAEQWSQHQQQQGGGYAPPPAPDAGAGPDTSFSASGGDFGDSGGASGGDFGGGGGDFGGGGGDFGGGGGGDSGGGGGDF